MRRRTFTPSTANRKRRSRLRPERSLLANFRAVRGRWSRIGSLYTEQKYSGIGISRLPISRYSQSRH